MTTTILRVPNTLEQGTKVAHNWNPCRVRVPTVQSCGREQKWPTSGPDGCVTPAVRMVPNTVGWGTISKVAHKCGYITCVVCELPNA